MPKLQVRQRIGYGGEARVRDGRDMRTKLNRAHEWISDACSQISVRERLIFKPWQIADVNDVHVALQDSSVRQALLISNPCTIADAEALVVQWAAESYYANPVIECAVVEAETRDIVGSATIRFSGTRPRAAELDYVVYPLFRHHGYAVDVVRMLTDLALERGAARVELCCALDDLARAKTALAAGLRYEGVLRGAILTLRGEDSAAVFARLPGDSGAPVRAALPELPANGIGDGVIVLRVATAADAVALHAEQSNTEARRWALLEPPSATEVAARAARAGLEWLVGPAGLMVIVDNASGQVAGRIVLRAVVPPQVADVGYGVLPAFRGRGYAARALRVLAGWTFEEAGYARLELGVKPGNAASRAVALSGGFMPEGTRGGRLRVDDDSFSDELHFSLVNPRYRIADAS